MRFTKMHGIGNDYLYIDGFQETVKDPEALARQMSDRHFGVGSDGLILILPSAQADFRMRMFNADGSEAEMCGNGIRCLAKYVHDHGLTRKHAITVETLAGTLTLELTVQGGKVARVRVDMGRPRLERGEIPMLGVPGQVVNEPLAVGDRSFQVTAVSMGNPHCVSFVPDVAAFPVATYGPLIERHPAFPRRTNAEFVEVLGPGELRIRTWERGAGETLACATGASATVVAAALTGRAARRAVAHLLGGDLEIEWAADDHVYMTGPAVEVFQGEWPEG